MCNIRNNNAIPYKGNDEYFDIVDTNGNPTGQVKQRGLIHRDGDLHRSVHMWITDGKRVLLQKRSPQKDTFPGKWDISAAGHVSVGESLQGAVLREVLEELGLDMRWEEFTNIGRLFQRYRTDIHNDNELVDIFVVHKTPPLHTLRIESEEVSCVVYISVHLFETLIRKNDSRLVPHQQEYELLFNHIKGL